MSPSERSAGTNPADLRAAEVSISAEVATIHLQSYGEPVQKIQTSILEDAVICVLDVALLTHERTLQEAGHDMDSVRQIRKDYQEAIAPSFVAAVEHATGRRVVGFLSDTHIDPAFSIEFFRLGPDLGDG